VTGRPGRRGAFVALAVAPVVGSLWWALAPGGRTAVGGGLAGLQAPAAQDAWFATLGAAVGLVLSVLWVVGRPVPPDGAMVRRLVGLLLGSLAGSVAAWGIGVGLDRVLAAVGHGAGGDLRLGSSSALLVWPLVASLVVAADAARDAAASAIRSRAHASGPDA
jgi:hypothetical protein